MPAVDAGAASMAASRRIEQSGDLGDGCGAGVDVPHRGPARLVAGLGHDQLQRDLLVAEVACCGVAQLVQVPSGELLEQDPGAVVAESGPAGVNTLFVLNAIGAGAIALVLAGSRGFAAMLGSLAAIGLTLGALVSLAITRTTTLFDYSEPTLRTAVVYAACVEAVVVLALAAFLLTATRKSKAIPRVDWTHTA